MPLPQSRSGAEGEIVIKLVTGNTVRLFFRKVAALDAASCSPRTVLESTPVGTKKGFEKSYKTSMPEALSPRDTGNLLRLKTLRDDLSPPDSQSSAAAAKAVKTMNNLHIFIG